MAVLTLIVVAFFLGSLLGVLIGLGIGRMLGRQVGLIGLMGSPLDVSNFLRGRDAMAGM